MDRLFTEEAKSDPEHPNLVVRGTNRKVIELENGVRWAAPTPPTSPVTFGNRKVGWIESR